MKDWIQNYLQAQKVALDSIPAEKVQRILDLLHGALKEDRQVLVFGNGGSAANSSHFATDLGKGASDKLGRRFRVMSLNENAGWMTAIGNDYAYEDIFLRQIENHGRQGDIALTMSVSGNSPSCIKAIEWAKKNGLVTIALLGAQNGALAGIADHVLVINDTHFGRVEDAHMSICHMLCYAFMERAAAFPV